MWLTWLGKHLPISRNIATTVASTTDASATSTAQKTAFMEPSTALRLSCRLCHGLPTNTCQEHKTVNIFVFDLDSNGNPTSSVLFSRENVANIDNEWNTFEFPAELTAPRGYMLAISADGHAGLGIAKASDEYPFTERENCYSDDYKSGNFTYIEEHNINRPLMIRATGVDIADAKLPLVTTPKYEVFRCAEADTDDPTKWVKLTAAPQQERTIADTPWHTPVWWLSLWGESYVCQQRRFRRTPFGSGILQHDVTT